MANLVNVDVGQISTGIFQLVEHLFPTEASREQAKLALFEMEQRGQFAQIGVNTAEAQHESIFVAGWRPFIGWVCGLAFVYSFIFQPFLVFVAWMVGHYAGHTLPVDQLPALDMNSLMVVLGGMLGLGGMRSFEKHTGSNHNRTTYVPAAPATSARPRSRPRFDAHEGR